MKPAGRDPLLFAAQALLWAFIAVLGVALTAVALAIPLAVAFQGEVLDQLAEQGIVAGNEVIGAILLIMLCVAALLALGVYFFVLLRRIVTSVKLGDPFVAENAQRLSRMGWVALAGQVILLPLGGLAMWMDELKVDEDKFDIHTGFGLDFGILLLVLILFILARVFRQGAAMRDELEGTV